jgi:hypothetical protein
MRRATRAGSRSLRSRLLAGALLPFVGCAPAPDPDPPGPWDRTPVSIQGRIAYDGPAPGTVAVVPIGESDTLHLHPGVEFWDHHVSRASAEASERLVTLRIEFTRAGARRVESRTQRELGARFALTVNGHVVAAPRIAQAVRVDPGVPVEVEWVLPEDEAAEFAAAVARTWPDAAVPEP